MTWRAFDFEAFLFFSGRTFTKERSFFIHWSFLIQKGLVHQNLMTVAFPDWQKLGEEFWSFRSGM